MIWHSNDVGVWVFLGLFEEALWSNANWFGRNSIEANIPNNQLVFQ
jgi:hypothetical protein